VNVVGGQHQRMGSLRLRRYISALIWVMMQAQVSVALEVLSSQDPALGLRAFEFFPSEPLDISVFGFKKDECRRCFDLGMRDADAHMRDPMAHRVL